MITEFYIASPALYYALLAALGLIVGSFLNVVIHRLPVSLQHDWKSQCSELLEQPFDKPPPDNIAFPGSRCPECKTHIRFWQNIPLISYVFLRGKCASCGQKISLRYPLVELFTAALTVLIGSAFPNTALPWMLVLSWALIGLTFIDIDCQLLPDIITLPLLWLGLIYHASSDTLVDPADAIIGAAIGYLSLWLLYHVYRLATGKHGMGYGDFKLFAVAGAWLGWQSLPIVILIAAVVGSIVGIAQMAFQDKGRHTAISFGPYLALGLLVTLIWGNQIYEAYIAFLLR